MTPLYAEMSRAFSYNTFQSFFPQIAYIDRRQSGSTEIVAVILPEAVQGVPTHPYRTHPDFNTRLSVIDVRNWRELWTYEYQRNETTPLWSFGCNANTKMLIADDALFVAYVKAASPLSRYIDTTQEQDLFLHIDRFALNDGKRIASVFPLGVQGNTIQLDDFAAADGRLLALTTYREWHRGMDPLEHGGGQLVACVTHDLNADVRREGQRSDR